MERKGIKFFRRKILEYEINQNIKNRVGKLIILKYIPPNTLLPTNKISHMSYVKCQCDCGNITYISWNKIKTLHTKSCGCFGKELHKLSNKEKLFYIEKINKNINLKLLSIEEKNDYRKKLKKEFSKLKIKSFDKKIKDLSRRKLYNKLAQINYRCYNKNSLSYNFYGKRGIFVCDEWKFLKRIPKNQKINQKIFNNFYKWYHKKLKELNLSYDEAYDKGYSIDRIDNNGPYSPENCRIVKSTIQNYNKRNNIYLKYKNTFIKNSILRKIFNKNIDNLVKKYGYNLNIIFKYRKDLKIKFNDYIKKYKINIEKYLKKDIDKKMKNIEYNEDSIQSYDTRTGIRKKISMYIGAIGPEGSFKAIQEIFLNSLDEFEQSNCYLEMIYETQEKIYTNFDNGRGIPLGKMEEILTTLHSGGKLDTVNNNSAYDDPFGAMGCGLAIVSSVSNWFIIECHRDGKSKRLEFKDGYKINEIDRELKQDEFQHGTWIRFQLAEEVFGDTNIDISRLYEAAELMSYTSPGFNISLTVDKSKTRYFSSNGLIDYLKEIIKRNKWEPMTDQISFKFDSNDYNSEKKLIAKGEIHFTFDKKQGDKIIAYTNRFKNIEGGSHVTGFKQGITMALNKYMEDNEKIPKKYEKMNVTGSIINDYIIALISINMKNPFFKNQTKDQLLSDEVTGWVKSKVYNLFLNWLNLHPKEADKIIKFIIVLCEARYAAKAAKDKILGIDKKESFVNSAVSKRLEDCLSKNPEECELFIVEGESASVGSARNPQNQAYYLLRGKIFNSIASNKLEDDILLDFINMLGIGFGEKKNLNKLRYHKIILLADADEDGYHITALLLGFFYKYYPELITQGHIYIGNPPLYAIELKKDNKKIFIKNIDHYNYILVQTILNKFDAFADISGKQIPFDIFEIMLYGLIDYMNYLDNFSNQQNITPQLLENIILYYKDIQKNNFRNIEKRGYKVSLKEETETHKIITFDEDIHHYNVNFNEKFYSNIYIPIITKIAKDIKIYNIYLKDKETNQVYKGSLYEYSQLMNKIFEGKISPKIKGLGEMKSEYLQTSVIDPSTRNLTKVTMEDAEKATKIIETFLGKKYMDEKKAHFESSMDKRKMSL